jgi:hypothetical protein
MKVSRRNQFVAALAISSLIGCSPTRVPPSNCVASLATKPATGANPESQIQLKDQTTYGGFIVALEAKDTEALLKIKKGDFRDRDNKEVYGTAIFHISKIEGGYKIKAYSHRNMPYYGYTDRLYIMLFSQGSYIKIPVESQRLKSAHNAMKEFQLHDYTKPATEPGNAALNVMMQFWSQVPQWTSSHGSIPGICSAGIEHCQDFGAIGVQEFTVPLNTLSLNIYSLYNKEINEATEASDIAARTKLIDGFKASAIAALDQAVHLTPKLTEHRDLAAWMDLLDRLHAINQKEGTLGMYYDQVDCAGNHCVFSNDIVTLANKHLSLDNGRCEFKSPNQIIADLKATPSMTLRTCGGQVLGDLVLDTKDKTDDMIYEEYLKEEQRITYTYGKTLYLELLKKDLPIKIASNFVYQETLDANGIALPELNKVFFHEFDLAMSGVRTIIHPQETVKDFNFFTNLKFHGLGEKRDGIYLEIVQKPFSQLNLAAQQGTLVSMNGFPLHSIPITASQDGGGQIIPPPPLVDLPDTTPEPAPNPAPGGGGTQPPIGQVPDPKPPVIGDSPSPNPGSPSDPDAPGPIVDTPPADGPDDQGIASAPDQAPASDPLSNIEDCQ